MHLAVSSGKNPSNTDRLLHLLCWHCELLYNLTQQDTRTHPFCLWPLAVIAWPGHLTVWFCRSSYVSLSVSLTGQAAVRPAVLTCTRQLLLYWSLSLGAASVAECGEIDNDVLQKLQENDHM